MSLSEPVGSGTVGFLARELDRVVKALREPQPPERYSQLYLIRQVLSWSLDPENFMSPVEAVERPGALTVRQGTPEAPEDCSADRRPLLSSDTGDRMGWSPR